MLGFHATKAALSMKEPKSREVRGSSSDWKRPRTDDMCSFELLGSLFLRRAVRCETTA